MNTTYTSSNINTINRQEEEPKNLKHASIQPNGGGNSDKNFSRTRPRDATGNNDHRKRKKTLRSNVKTKLDHFGNVVNLLDNLF